MKKTITREDVLRYAEASNDKAAIHIDDHFAKKSGFNRPIVHGMYLMGVAQSIYLKEHPTSWIYDYFIKFQQPLLVDEEVVFQFDKKEDWIEVSIQTNDARFIAVGHFKVKEWNF